MAMALAFDSDPARVAGADRPGGSATTLHDKILIIDLGSQVTELIARRVREHKV